jgi:hypothetical protein
LQEATDAFLHGELGLASFDRFYVPGGAGALSAIEGEAARAEQLRGECKYLIELHQVKQIILLFHGPAANGPPDAVCADYRRKFPLTAPDILRHRQAQDAAELLQLRDEWTVGADVSVYRCEVDAGRTVHFRTLDIARELREGAPVAR